MHQEIYFEQAMEQSLIGQGGYEKGDAAGFDAGHGLFPDEVIAFVQASQPRRWQSLVKLQGEQAGEVLLGALVKELASKHALHVLRHGFKCFGKTFRLAFFAPNTGMNPEAAEAYGHNRLRVTRQVHFSEKHPKKSLDMVLSVNGLPVVTLELKNPMTGQTVEDAMRQYRRERDPDEPIFRFKQRALVHFAVDPDQVFMATRLAGEADTRFLPFNRGHEFGAGNPPAADDNYRTAYLWEEVLTRDSLMDILARFLHLEVSEKKIATKRGVKRHKKETMIFPRYHQLDAVRKLIASSREKGAGHNYLVQHSAGSGKSNSIAWLAHRLSSLHDAADEKVFDSVVIITDRRVLDQQLQNTVYQFEHKQGVVQKIDENTQQLAQALSSGVPIIISTIQKFPFITQAMDMLAKKGQDVSLATGGKRFAVIVDEAHSSQSGETAMELRKVLNRDGIESAIAAEFLDVEEEDLSEQARKALFEEMLKRPRQPNISFFAFTATPKFKTLAVFNEPGAGGQPPFHLYSMRQAIEEGFIMDVLAHYTTYKTYYGLIKSIEDDPQVPRRKAALALARFMSLHPHNIAQKVEVIVEHFRNHTRHKIGGRAKAMVVTASRLHAVRYKQAFDKYIEDNNISGIRSLVAFSGSVTDPDFPDRTYTEVGMNEGIKESELPEKFDSEHYQVLLVAEKYQTGFDQPLLHTMYVDRRLAGIQAVQTLSRLNRTAEGKNDTFVLDFVNDTEEIFEAFKPYYEITPPGEPSDPQQLYDLQHRLEQAQVFYADEVNAFAEIWYRNRHEPTAADHRRINAVIDQAVERYKALPDDEQEGFKSQLASFRNLYAFLAQIIPYQDSSLEKLYSYARFLLSKLPRRTDDTVFELEDEVSLKYYRLQKISEGAIDLAVGEAKALYGPTEVGTGRAEEDTVELSSLIDRLNERFGTEFTPADQLFFDQIAETAVENETLQAAAKANSMDNFAYVFEKMLEGLFIERMDGNEDIFGRLMNDDDFRRVAGDHLLHEVYHRLQTGDGAGRQGEAK
ncbi:type I restriction endonuclease subunit R [Wenzhouxiangella sp. AB-CW3]|uniref:type I restriction endonuclease subunit R n=1 Tax=Wenzhouxiangella sp. AB-CW3 TaxID=2771012 RepID=UPI00168B28D3|nr:type I restriction endonuclease [Wenzhouxiangella sp. AB-CW3]QOC24084.1 type I restriction endonuclease subunit R [Wenzhouxiangella sp. AB-CW3]